VRISRENPAVFTKEVDKDKEIDIIKNISFLILQSVYIWLTLPISELPEVKSPIIYIFSLISSYFLLFILISS